MKLNKAIYGLKQSGRLWYDTLRLVLETLGYRASSYDNCIFSKQDSNGLHIIVAYVDDLMILFKCDKEHDRVMNAMKNEFNEITVSADKAPSTEYIGMKLEINPDKSVTVSMDQYINKVLSELEVVNVSKSPFHVNLFTPRKSDLLSEDMQHWMRSTIAILLYIGKRARSDLLLSISVLASRVNQYNGDDVNKLYKL